MLLAADECLQTPTKPCICRMDPWKALMELLMLATDTGQGCEMHKLLQTLCPGTLGLLCLQCCKCCDDGRAEASPIFGMPCAQHTTQQH